MATSRKEQREQARAERWAREEADQARQRRARRLWQLGGALTTAAVIVIVAIAVSSSSGSAAGGSPVGHAAYASQVQRQLGGIPQQGLTIGSPAATVTLTEFADLQCPFCRDYTTQDLPPIIANYVRTGKVKMVFRNVTFLGQDSVTAAQAAAAAGAQNKLWNFVDVWYHNQGEENSGYVTDAFIRKIASVVPGLDVARLMRDRNSPAVAQQLAEAQTLMTQMQVTFTPTLFVQRGGGQQTEVSDTTQLPAALDKALSGA